MKNKFFQLARKMSFFSDHPQHKLGSVIVRRNKVVSLGYNKNKTHTASKHIFQRLHAEVSAIINAKEDISGCDIYIYRETKNGSLGKSFPCESCFAALSEAMVSRIFFCDVDGFKEYKI